MQITLKDYCLRSIREAHETATKAQNAADTILNDVERLRAAETYRGEWNALIIAAITHATNLLRDALSDAAYNLTCVIEAEVEVEPEV